MCSYMTAAGAECLSWSESFDDCAIMSKTVSRDRPDKTTSLITITSSPTCRRPAQKCPGSALLRRDMYTSVMCQQQQTCHIALIPGQPWYEIKSNQNKLVQNHTSRANQRCISGRDQVKSSRSLSVLGKITSKSDFKSKSQSVQV